MKNVVDHHLAFAIVALVNAFVIMATHLPTDIVGSWEQVEIVVIILVSHYVMMSINFLDCRKKKTFEEKNNEWSLIVVVDCDYSIKC